MTISNTCSSYEKCKCWLCSPDVFAVVLSPVHHRHHQPQRQHARLPVVHEWRGRQSTRLPFRRHHLRRRTPRHRRSRKTSCYGTLFKSNVRGDVINITHIRRTSFVCFDTPRSCSVGFRADRRQSFSAPGQPASYQRRRRIPRVRY